MKTCGWTHNQGHYTLLVRTRSPEGIGCPSKWTIVAQGVSLEGDDGVKLIFPMHYIGPFLLTTNYEYSVHRLNASGRGLNDHVVAMDIDNPSTTGSFTYRVLKMPGYSGVAGDGKLQVVSVSGTKSADGSQINLYLVNNRPSVDPKTGTMLDNTKTGANTTIDVFSTTPGSDFMKHVKTFADAQISTPNNVAVTKDGGFFFTNDHGPHKFGLVSHR